MHKKKTLKVTIDQDQIGTARQLENRRKLSRIEGMSRRVLAFAKKNNPENIEWQIETKHSAELMEWLWTVALGGEWWKLMVSNMQRVDGKWDWKLIERDENDRIIMSPQNLHFVARECFARGEMCMAELFQNSRSSRHLPLGLRRPFEEHIRKVYSEGIEFLRGENLRFIKFLTRSINDRTRIMYLAIALALLDGLSGITSGRESEVIYSLCLRGPAFAGEDYKKLRKRFDKWLSENFPVKRKAQAKSKQSGRREKVVRLQNAVSALKTDESYKKWLTARREAQRIYKSPDSTFPT